MKGIDRVDDVPEPSPGDEFWPRLGERLAHEFGEELWDGVRAWTQRSGESLAGAASHAAVGDDAAELPSEELRVEVTSVGFLVGCFGAALGSDVLRARREQRLVELVLAAMTRLLATRRGVSATVGEGVPSFPGTSGDWRAALLIAWGLWRVTPGRRVLGGDAKTRLDFGGAVAWDEDLVVAAPPGVLAPTGLDFVALPRSRDQTLG